MTSEDLQSLLNSAYFYLKFRLRSEKEVRDYLYKKIKKRHFSRDDADEVIKKLKDQNFINDKEFIRWFVELRNKSKPKSVFVLKGELLRFGIAKELIEEYFMNNEQDDTGLALKALTSRWKRYGSLSKEKRFQKAVSFLGRRGFSFEIIRKIIDKMEEKMDEINSPID